MTTSNIVPLHEGIQFRASAAMALPTTRADAPPLAIDIPSPDPKLRGTRRTSQVTYEAALLEELRTRWPFGEMPAEAIAELTGVDTTTARRWRRTRKLPKPIQLLGHILVHGDLGAIHASWAGWKLHRGDLSGPNSRQPFTPSWLDAHCITAQRVAALEAVVRRQNIELHQLRSTAAATPEKRKLENAMHRTWQLERLAEAMLSEFGVTVHECVSEADCDLSIQRTGQIDSAYQQDEAATAAESGAEAVFAALDAAKKIRATCRKRIDALEATPHTPRAHS